MTASDTMPTHKFKIGQTVFLSPSLGIPGGAYVATRKLPEREGEFEYRVKSANEPACRARKSVERRAVAKLGVRFTKVHPASVRDAG
jgi:hypothetical protein